jgi:hypothetical protein
MPLTSMRILYGSATSRIAAFDDGVLTDGAALLASLALDRLLVVPTSIMT